MPVYTIAFGTADGVIDNPDTGLPDPVPVKLDELQAAADATGGKAYVAPSADDWRRPTKTSAPTCSESIGDRRSTTINELTWRYVLAAVVLLMIAWALGLWWLRGPL